MRIPIVLVCIWIMQSASLAFGVPAITSPAPGTKLTGTTVTFSWDADGYTSFQFYGADHIAPYQSGTITDTSITIAGLPDDGSPVFVKLSYWAESDWETINYFYQASGSGAKLPSMLSPSPGTDLTSSSQTFQWDFGDYKVDTWRSFILELGSAPLGSEIFSEITGSNTTIVSKLPQDNSTVYATLWYWDGLEWKNVSYTYFSKKFPWPMFLPAITTPHECSIDYLGLCTDETSCRDAGAYWWAKECHESMSSSQAFMARLAGNIHFTYTMFGIDWNEYYHFDINTLQESPYQSGLFEIYGTDAYGNQVKVYEYGLNFITGHINYIFINYGFSPYKETFIFRWDDASKLHGTFKYGLQGGDPDDVIRANLYGTYSK